MTQEKFEIQSRFEREKAASGLVEERNKQIHQELDTLRSEVISLKDERNLAQSQLDSTKRSLQFSQLQKDDFSKALQTQLDGLQLELHGARTRSDELQIELRASQNRLLKADAQSQETLEIRRQETEGLDQQVGRLAASVQELTEELLQVTKQLEETQNLLAEVEIERNEANAMTDLKAQELLSTRDEGERLVQNFLQLRKENEALLKRHNSEMQDLSKANEELKLLLQTATNENKTRRTTIDELSVKLEDAAKSRTTLSESEQTELQRLHKSNRDLNSNVDALNEQLVELKQRYEDDVEKESAARHEAEVALADLNAQYEEQSVQRDMSERQRMEAEAVVRSEMEDVLIKSLSEAAEQHNRELLEARTSAKTFADQAAKAWLEAERTSMREDVQRHME